MSVKFKLTGATDKIVTVEDALAAYKQGKESNLSAEGYRSLDRSLVDFLIDAGVGQAFSNDSYFDALVLTEAMLDRTNHQVKIVTGCGCGGFYSALFPHLTTALDRIRISGGHAKMIVATRNSEYPEWLDALSREYDGVFSIGIVAPSDQVPHFIVCDGKIVRSERPHGELTKHSSAHEIKADVYFSSPDHGRILETSFDALWPQAENNRKAIGSKKISAPSWIIQRMDALRHQPPPTSEDVDTQLTASAAVRKTLSDNAVV